MPTDIEEIKNMIKEINNDPEGLLEGDDRLISLVIAVERKYLHGLEGGSERSRREDIERLILDHIKKEASQ